MNPGAIAAAVFIAEAGYVCHTSKLLIYLVMSKGGVHPCGPLPAKRYEPSSERHSIAMQLYGQFPFSSFFETTMHFCRP